jgi:hypothetical protein
MTLETTHTAHRSVLSAARPANSPFLPPALSQHVAFVSSAVHHEGGTSSLVRCGPSRPRMKLEEPVPRASMSSGVSRVGTELLWPLNTQGLVHRDDATMRKTHHEHESI